ncbi:hypothetical protein GGC63_006739 [Paenibacillus sp. OAS669]|nr:hypothetical protein [Paenibacillus sp. OAS669]
MELVLSSKFNASENFHSLFKHSLVVQFSKDNVLLFIVTLFSGDFYNISHSPAQLQVLFITTSSSDEIKHLTNRASKATKSNIPKPNLKCNLILFPYPVNSFPENPRSGPWLKPIQVLCENPEVYKVYIEKTYLPQREDTFR